MEFWSLREFGGVFFCLKKMPKNSGFRHWKWIFPGHECMHHISNTSNPQPLFPRKRTAISWLFEKLTFNWTEPKNWGWNTATKMGSRCFLVVKKNPNISRYTSNFWPPFLLGKKSICVFRRWVCQLSTGMTQQLKSPWSLFKALDTRRHDVPSSEEGAVRTEDVGVEWCGSKWVWGEFWCFPLLIFRVRDNAWVMSVFCLFVFFSFSFFTGTMSEWIIHITVDFLADGPGLTLFDNVWMVFDTSPRWSGSGSHWCTERERDGRRVGAQGIWCEDGCEIKPTVLYNYISRCCRVCGVSPLLFLIQKHIIRYILYYFVYVSINWKDDPKISYVTLFRRCHSSCVLTSWSLQGLFGSDCEVPNTGHISGQIIATSHDLTPKGS